MLRFTLPIAPRTKKNHGQVVMMGRYPRILPSKPYRAFEKAVVEYIEEHFGNIEPIDFPINLKCVFYKDKDYKSDLAGYLQAVQDALVKAGMLIDDNHKIVTGTDGSRVMLDRKEPRIEIEITKVSEG